MSIDVQGQEQDMSSFDLITMLVIWIRILETYLSDDLRANRRAVTGYFSHDLMIFNFLQGNLILAIRP